MYLQEAALESPERLEPLGDVGVDGAGIDDRGNFVERIPGPKTTVVTEAGLRADKVHAALPVLTEEPVVSRNLDRQTVGVDGTGSASLATLGSLSSSGVLSLSTQRDIVINKLAPGHQKDGHSVIVEAIVGVNSTGNVASSRQRLAADGGSIKKENTSLYGCMVGGKTIIVPGRADTVGKVRRQETMMTVHGRTPVGVFNVVTDAGDRAVALDLAFGGHEEIGAVALDGRLGGVDEWQSVGYSVLAEPILLGNVATRLVDDGSEVAHVLGAKFVSYGWQTDTISGRREGGVHSLVGDASVAV